MESPIKGIRLALSCNQKEFAGLAGVSQGHISNIENGLADIDDSLKVFLRRLKADVPKVIAEQSQFVKSKRTELMEKVTASVPDEEHAASRKS